MTRITTTGRDSANDAWAGLNHEQRCRLIRDMPSERDDDPDGMNAMRGLWNGLVCGVVLLALILGAVYIIAEGIHA